MNDLSALLDATQLTTCEFLGKTINLEVYTAGFSRLTHEEALAFRGIVQKYASENKRAAGLRDVIKTCEEAIKANPDDEEQKSKLTELQTEWATLDTGSVEQMRVVLPMMLASWSLNGEPMKRNGEDFPPTGENLATVPDNLLLAVGEAAQVIWSPTTATDGQATSSEVKTQKDGEPEENQAETIAS